MPRGRRDLTVASRPPQAPAPRAQPNRRLWAVIGAVVLVGFVALVVRSAGRSAVPVGASGAMGGMAMPAAPQGARMQMSMRDVDGRPVRIGDGHRGALVFVSPRSCPTCVDAVRVAAAAARRARPAAELTVVSVDGATSRGQMAAFARSTGRPPGARYVVDDRSGSLASMFGASRLGATVVYGAGGEVVARPASGAAIGRALARAAARG